MIMMLNDVEIKKELLDLLKKIDAILIKNGLNYSIMSGTLLGAIRHGGFIPWDDDIDIAMPREDYDKLVKLIKNGILDLYDLSATGYEIDRSYWPFVKILNPYIAIKQELDGQNPPGDNLWIDIFPFDYAPKNNIDNILKKISFQRKLLSNKMSQERQYYKYKKGFLRKIKYFTISIVYRFISLNKINDNIIKLCKGTGCKSDYIADMTWGRSDSSKFVAASLFDEIVDYQFEDITVKGFKDYDTYLKQIYGDYMKLPPEDQRENHGIKAWRVNNNEK